MDKKRATPLAPLVRRPAEPPCITTRDYHDDSEHIFEKGVIVRFGDSTFLSNKAGRLSQPNSMIARKHSHWICQAHRGQDAELDDTFIKKIFASAFKNRLHQLTHQQDAEVLLLAAEMIQAADQFIDDLDFGAI